MHTNTDIAVITGDLVNSTGFSKDTLEQALASLTECAEVMRTWHGAPLNFTRHRGDGWQVILAKPEMALRSALAFRAALKSNNENFESYMSIARGSAPEKVNADLNTHSEQPFIESGQRLEELKNAKQSSLFAYSPSGAYDAATILADQISHDWTGPQAAAMTLALDPIKDPTLTDIAKQLGKSRQAVTKSLNSAGFMNIELALNRLEEEVAP